VDDKSRAHRLSEMPGETLPSYMIFVDTETTQRQAVGNIIYQDFMLGVGIYWYHRKGRKNTKVETFRFTQVELFWEFVMAHCIKGTKLCLFAHNAVFDMTVLKHMHWLTQFGYKCEFVFDKGITFIAQWKRDDHTILILNTANWFLGSVAKWGEAIGLDKLEMPEDDATEEDWFIYCERDTVILLELTRWYFKFLKDYRLGSWKYTIASQAFTAFRHRFMPNKINIPDNDIETRLARASYKGGRTEVFKQGHYKDGPYYKVDVNSMYPYVMKEFSYPTSLAYVGKILTYEQAQQLRGRYGIIADCTICTPIPYFVEGSTGRNVYPIGTFRTTLTTNEFFRAFDNRWIQEVHEFATYRMRKIFVDYVSFFYNLKVKFTEQGNRLQRSFTKLYLNSLYGKFGQRGYQDEIIGETAEPGLAVWYAIDAQTHDHYMYRLIGTTLMRSWQEGEAYHAFCAVASHVTANARLYLYDAILRAGRENVWYSDTDSMIVNTEGYKRMNSVMDDTKLGLWALEGVSDEVEILAPKHYRFQGKWTRKGVRKNAQEIKDNVFKQEVWPGFNTILKGGDEHYFNKFVIKTLTPTIKTGQVVEGGLVVPLEMTMKGQSMAWYTG